MKKKFLLTLIAFVLTGSISAQNMYVKKNDNTQTVYSIQEVRKLTFTSGNLVITPNSGTPDQIPLNDLRYVSFQDYTVSVEEYKTDYSISLYPNPVKDLLDLKIETGNLHNVSYQIFNMNGQLITHGDIHGNAAQIDMTLLPASLYMLKIMQNNEDLKTFKIVKQ